jgi:putative ABC transport system ATP-binding protein
VPAIPSIEVKALTKEYVSGDTSVLALRGVDLVIQEGEFLVLLGPSGSGKSTFLNIIGGLDSPTSGEVSFRGKNLSHFSESELTLYRRESVGFVFQAYNLVPSLTARENVALVTEISKSPMEPMAALEAVQLADRAEHFPAQLSGGEQQRVAIARAIAKRPELLLCDEPTGALDSQTGAVVLQCLLDVNQEYNTTTAIITHNAMIAELADRVIIFADGHVTEIRENPNPVNVSDISW